MTLDRLLSGLGRFFIGAGILVFLFIAYQLWGTNIAEARNQNRLQAEAESLFSATPQTPTSTTVPATAAPGQTVPPTTVDTTPAPAPAPTGSAVAVIRIPKINLQKAVVQGTAVSDLKKGPGHYSTTPLPGQPGNAAIAGHRTTYGAPFGDIGELVEGDEIDVTTAQGQFVYRVTNKRIVSPTEHSVLDNTNDTRLTLTTCHPKFSAAQRLIVTAILAPGEVAAPATPVPSTAPEANEQDPIPGAEEDPSTVTTVAESEPTTTLDGESLNGDSTAKGPAILWGLMAALMGFAVWGAGRIFHRVPAYLLGTPIFLLTLFIFFENFARLLPASA